MPENGKKEICWELPVEGDGFISFNRNDVDADGLDQIGTYQTIQAILTIAKTMRGKGCPILEIGDISRAGGLVTSAHKTHNDGKAFDMSPIRNDGKISERGFTYKDIPPYHRAWTIEVIRTVKRLYSGSTIYFNDPDIFKDQEFRGYVVKMGEDDAPDAHANHLHIIFSGGERLTELEGK